jgi:hypothetical protein
VTPATFQQPDTTIGNINLTERRAWLDEGRGFANRVLGPAHALLDDSKARAIAVMLEDRFTAAERLFTDMLDQREALGRDQVTRPELLRAKRQELQDSYTEQAGQIRKQLAKLSDDLKAALLTEALPTPSSDTATSLAREEIKLALNNLRGKPPFQVLQEFAERGGDFAAVAASSWARLAFQEAAGETDVGYPLVLESAARSSLNSGDPARQRAAQTLAALTDNQGRDVLYTGAFYVNQVLESGDHILETPVP